MSDRDDDRTKAWATKVERWKREGRLLCCGVDPGTGGHAIGCELAATLRAQASVVNPKDIFRIIGI